MDAFDNTLKAHTKIPRLCDAFIPFTCRHADHPHVTHLAPSKNRVLAFHCLQTFNNDLALATFHALGS